MSKVWMLGAIAVFMIGIYALAANRSAVARFFTFSVPILNYEAHEKRGG